MASKADSVAGYFHPYLGSAHPWLMLLFVLVLGVVCARYLRSRGGLEIARTDRRRRGLLLAAMLATPLALVMIVVDASVVFPADINVPQPHALWFYPTIGLVAEVAFHLLPLSLLLLSLGPVIRRRGRDDVVRVVLALIALVEPMFQVTLGFSDTLPWWVTAYVAVHVLAFNLVQVYLYKRFDLATMYACRLVYYLHWHIVWGYLRLQLLF